MHGLLSDSPTQASAPSFPPPPSLVFAFFRLQNKKMKTNTLHKRSKQPAPIQRRSVSRQPVLSDPQRDVTKLPD